MPNKNRDISTPKEYLPKVLATIEDIAKELLKYDKNLIKKNYSAKKLEEYEAILINLFETIRAQKKDAQEHMIAPKIIGLFNVLLANCHEIQKKYAQRREHIEVSKSLTARVSVFMYLNKYKTKE